MCVRAASHSVLPHPSSGLVAWSEQDAPKIRTRTGGTDQAQEASRAFAWRRGQFQNEKRPVSEARQDVTVLKAAATVCSVLSTLHSVVRPNLEAFASPPLGFAGSIPPAACSTVRVDAPIGGDTYKGPLAGEIIANRWRVIGHLGGGAFGETFVLADREGKVSVAKMGKKELGQLVHEAAVLQYLNGCKGFPRIRNHFVSKGREVVVMQFLGPNLAELLGICGGRFTMKTTLMIADQMIGRLQTLHRHHLVHSDIKPANVCIGSGDDPDSLYLIDMGLCQSYRDPRTLHQRPLTHAAHRCGNHNFFGVHITAGVEASPRDDLEALGLMLVFLVKGRKNLPWHGRGPEAKDLALRTPLQEICRGLPRHFEEYFRYVRSLAYTETPDYEYLRGIFRSLYESLGYRADGHFDWSAAVLRRD